MKHYLHFLEIKLTEVTCISKKESLTEEELRDFVHSLDTATWHDEISRRNFDVKAYHVCPCNEDGLIVCAEE